MLDRTQSVFNHLSVCKHYHLKIVPVSTWRLLVESVDRAGIGPDALRTQNERACSLPAKLKHTIPRATNVNKVDLFITSIVPSCQRAECRDVVMLSTTSRFEIIKNSGVPRFSLFSLATQMPATGNLGMFQRALLHLKDKLRLWVLYILYPHVDG